MIDIPASISLTKFALAVIAPVWVAWKVAEWFNQRKPGKVKVYWRPRLYALDRTGKRYWERIQIDVYEFKSIEESKQKLL